MLKFVQRIKYAVVHKIGHPRSFRRAGHLAEIKGTVHALLQLAHLSFDISDRRFSYLRVILERSSRKVLALCECFIDFNRISLRSIKRFLRLSNGIDLFGIQNQTGDNATNSDARQYPWISSCKSEQRFKSGGIIKQGFGCSRHERNHRGKPGTNGQCLKNILVFCQSIKSRLQAADRPAHGIDASNGGVGVDNGAFKKRPFGRKAVERPLQPLRRGFGGGPEIFLHDLCQLRQKVFGGELAVRHKLIQFRRGHVHGLGRELERTGEPFAELPPQFFGLYLAFADHLAERDKRAVHVVCREREGGPGGRHGLKDAVHVLFERGIFARSKERLCRFCGALELQPQAVAHVIEIGKLLLRGGRRAGDRGVGFREAIGLKRGFKARLPAESHGGGKGEDGGF